MKGFTGSCYERYQINARRCNEEEWSKWTQTQSAERAFEHVDYVRSCGFLARLIDTYTREVLVIDR